MFLVTSKQVEVILMSYEIIIYNKFYVPSVKSFLLYTRVLRTILLFDGEYFVYLLKVIYGR